MSSKEGLEELRNKFAAAFGAAGLSGEEVAVIYRVTNSGFGQSCRGYFLLQFLGYRAAILHGGYQAWLAERTAKQQTTTPQPREFPIDSAAAGVMLTRDDMLAALDDQAIVKFDVRDVEWVGISSSPYGIDHCPRKGRIRARSGSSGIV